MKIVTLDEIAARVSSRLRADIRQVRQALVSSVEVMREEVGSGHGVDLPNLITLDSRYHKRAGIVQSRYPDVRDHLQFRCAS